MSTIQIPEMFLPVEGTDLSKWSIVACDQFTSQRDYWNRVEQYVGNDPSTYRLTLPEVYLEDENVKERIDSMYGNLVEYIQRDKLRMLPHGAILVERFTNGNPIPRRGIVISIDLEDYNYMNEPCLVRPTEKTILGRIPPRLEIRHQLSVEFPHTLLLIDDEKRSIIEPLFFDTSRYQQLYDVQLMENGGHLKGYFLQEGEILNRFMEEIEKLGDPKVFAEKYGFVEGAYTPLQIAVGDGNHSMATAKAYWEELKKTLIPSLRERHPARFALAELMNLHDERLEFEAIHRVLFQIDVDDFFVNAISYCKKMDAQAYVTDRRPEDLANAHIFEFYSENKGGFFVVENPPWSIAHATLQTIIDRHLKVQPNVKEDYIHGKDVVRKLGMEPNNLGFILPELKKTDLFPSVILEGTLPKKTFSMGEAHEKRYYMEGKTIV